MLVEIQTAFSPIFREVTNLLDPSRSITPKDCVNVLDRYQAVIDGLARGTLGSDDHPTRMLDSQKEKVTALSTVLGHLYIKDHPREYLLRGGLQVGLGLSLLFPKEGEREEDFLGRLVHAYSGEAIPWDPWLDNTSLREWNIHYLRDPEDKGYAQVIKISRQGRDYVLKSEPHHNNYDYHWAPDRFLHELMIQGGVALAPDPDQEPIWPIEDLVVWSGVPHLGMRWATGGTYDNYTGNFWPLDISKLEELERLAALLKRIHEKKIAHLDIHPDNIFRVEKTPKAMDFGLAVSSENITQNDERRLRCGRRTYQPTIYTRMQNTGNLWDGLRRDVHAMALTIHTLIFGNESISQAPLACLPPPLDQVLSKALSPNFKDKHPDGTAFYEDFHQAAEKIRTGAF